METIQPRKHDPTVPSGMAIWAVVNYLKYFDWDHEKTVDIMEGALTKSDVEYAERYYREHRDEIEFRLRQISGSE